MVSPCLECCKSASPSSFTLWEKKKIVFFQNRACESWGFAKLRWTKLTKVSFKLKLYGQKRLTPQMPYIRRSKVRPARLCDYLACLCLNKVLKKSFLSGVVNALTKLKSDSNIPVRRECECLLWSWWGTRCSSFSGKFNTYEFIWGVLFYFSGWT